MRAEQDALRERVKAWKDERAKKRVQERAEAGRRKRRYDAAWDRFIAAFDRHWDACRKAGFNPAQPRVPAGNPDGGQWTSEEGNGARAETSANPSTVSALRKRETKSIRASSPMPRPTGYPVRSMPRIVQAAARSSSMDNGFSRRPPRPLGSP